MKAAKIHRPVWALVSMTFLGMLLECLRETHLPPADLAAFRDGVIDYILSRSGQILILLCLVFWYLVLLWIKIEDRAGPPGRNWRAVMTPDEMCKMGLVVCVLAAYIRPGSCAGPVDNNASLLLGIDQSTNLLVLLFGVVVSCVAALLTREGGKDGFSMRRAILTSLVVFLAIASFVRSEGHQTYLYRAQVRWTGLWVNPNTFGLLMAMGTVISVGLIRVTWNPGRWGSLNMLLYTAAAAATGVGLFHSYSRGAWVAFCCGLVSLDYHSDEASRLSQPKIISWIRRRALLLVVAAFSVSTVAYWQFHDTQHRIVRRILSICNENDFSSRNRLAAYEGALQMCAEAPWWGFGWNQPETVYTQYYRPADVEEGMAIQLNDYFTLATTLGLPALVCFVAYVCMGFGLKARREIHPVLRSRVEYSLSEESRMSFIRVVCRSGVIVLLVGFFFEGGLFKVVLAVPFWILLELESF
jgi:O-antigen ligase